MNDLSGTTTHSLTGVPRAADTHTHTRARRWMPKAPLRLKRHGASVGVVTGQLYIAGGWDGLSSVSTLEYPVSTL